MIDKKFVGTDDLRKRLTLILKKLAHDEDEVIITQHGKPTAVLLDIKTYLGLSKGKAKPERPEVSYKKPVEELESDSDNLKLEKSGSIFRSNQEDYR